ncbi:MAG: TIM barrel protein [Planctomycetaceae bacterium]|jgi:hydroxypyruvate isomerase|nr:TIM barrel protein [Planctomycetaceae bacterium]
MFTRRTLLKSICLTSFALPAVHLLGSEKQSAGIKQSVCYGAYRKIPLDELAPAIKKIGLVGLDLVNPDEWEAVQKHGLIVTLSRAPGATIGKGFNHTKNHEALIAHYSELIPAAAKANVKSIICFSGNREGISDEEGLENAAKGLKQLMPLAEQHGVVLIMELLNSIVNHKDYQADHTDWGAELAKRIGSENFKLLYDIYHLQIMEGNLIYNIRKYKDAIGHYHTAGNPGRKDLDNEQEIYYPAVIRAILETGFQGYLAHEFSPKKQENLESLQEAFRVCNVSLATNN